MITVFVGGSRRMSRINGLVGERLDRIIDSKLSVVVGDANGADKAFQKYLHERDYRSVRVFYSGNRARNNVGGWDGNAVQSSARRGTLAFYTAKDRAMADEASVALMLWDGKSYGTLMNCERLVRQGKSAVIYVAGREDFVEIRTKADWQSFLESCSADVVRGLEERLGREDVASSGSPSLFTERDADGPKPAREEASSRPSAKYTAPIDVRRGTVEKLATSEHGRVSIELRPDGMLWAFSNEEFDSPGEFEVEVTNALADVGMDLLWETGLTVDLQVNSVLVQDAPRHMTLALGETIAISDERPVHSFSRASPFGPLADLKDRVLHRFLADGDAEKEASLGQQGALQLALDHAARGLLDCEHAFAHYYSVFEIVRDYMVNADAGRNWFGSFGISRAQVDSIKGVANDRQYDQRHPPRGGTRPEPLPTNAHVSAAATMRRLIEGMASHLIAAGTPTRA